MLVKAKTWTPESTRTTTLASCGSAIDSPFSNGMRTIRYSSFTKPISVVKCWGALVPNGIWICNRAPTCKRMSSNVKVSGLVG